MSEGKVFIIEKEKKFVHVVAFKVGDEGLAKLDQCFEFMRVKGKRRSDKMRDFIDRVYALIGEVQKLSVDAKEYPKLVAKYEKLMEMYEQTKSENVGFRKQIAKLTKEKSSLMNALSKLGHKKRVPGPIYRPSETGPIHRPSQTIEVEKPQPNKEAKPSPTIKEERKEVQPLQRQGDYFTCPQTKRAYIMKDLPCLANPMYSCSNKFCEEQVMALIR